jgi:hypothetical protein
MITIHGNELISTVRNDVSGSEETMVIEDVVVHPNFTDYQHDIGNREHKKLFKTIKSFTSHLIHIIL